MSSLPAGDTSGQGTVLWCAQTPRHKGIKGIEERRERVFDSALEAEGDMKERLKNVQSEVEELRALGLEI
jgi:hypothetical protein